MEIKLENIGYNFIENVVTVDKIPYSLFNKQMHTPGLRDCNLVCQLCTVSHGSYVVLWV